MQPIMKDETVNSKLFQFKLALKKHLIYSRHNIEWIFQRVGNLDDQVQTTKYLKSHHPEWIGCTALHFAAHLRNADAYKILVDRGTDITLKNNDGSTALHIAIEENPEDRLVPDLFVHSILSAHLKQNNFENPCNKDGLSHFHIACLAENVELVEQFLNHGVSVNHAVKMESTSFSGFTPLHFSVEYRCITMTKVLLSRGASMLIKDSRGLTPLDILLRENLEFADPAIAEKCGVDMFSEVAIDREVTELAKRLEVVHPGKKESLATILELFHIHHRTGNMLINDTGLSQLHLSCLLRDKEETEGLLQKALDINHRINMNSPVWPGYTALHFAAHVDIDTVKLLLANGANIEAKDFKGLTPFDICLRKYKVSDIHSLMLMTPSWRNIVLSDAKTRLTDVIFAMRDADRFKKFLRRLAKNLHVHVPNSSLLWPGFSMMHLAVILSKREALKIDQSMQQILLELFYRAPDLLQQQEAHGWTPLHLAYRLRKDEVISALISYHQTLVAPSDYVDEDGLSHVHIACTLDSEDFLEKLLLNGSNTNAVYRGTLFTWRGIYPGSTPLHFAVNYKNGKAIETLLKYRANVYAKDENNMTPVHLLVATINEPYGHEYLLLNLPNLKDSVVDGVGLSHLHVACLGGYYLSTNNLLRNGANVHQKLTTEPITNEVLKCLNEWSDCTPLKVAFKKGCQDCVDVIMAQDPGFPVDGDDVLYDILWGRDDSFVYPRKLQIDEELMTRLKVNTGMTALHLLCWLYVQHPDELARLAVEANVRIREDSPIWPGWTPVHVLLSRTGSLLFQEQSFDLLLEAGVDVLLANVDGDTAVHLAYKCYRNPENRLKLHSLVNKLLQAQKDFSVDPASIEGLSHFHVACAMSNAPIVEKFLQNSRVDVNRPIDFFNETLGGQTPLHLVASGKNANTDVSMQMRTVELLLKHGANVRAENNRGNTVLHECFDSHLKSVDVFERIAKEGADVNARNILGHTPLKCFLSKGRISVEEIIRLLELGCHLNAFNPVTEEGCFGEALSCIPVEEIESFVSTLKNDFARLLEVDDEGRTIIHNFASILTEDEICLVKWVSWIEHLSSLGNDIDDRDSKGRTPLHMAVKLQSVQAISALLMAGADVNLVDVEDITAFNHCLRGCEQCEEIFDDCEGDLDDYEFDNNDDDDDSAPCRHIQMFKIMAIHVRKMLHCGLDVSEDNLDDSEEARWKSKDVNEFSEEFLEKLEQVEKVTIEPCSIPLSDLLSENGVVVDFATMSLAKRASINEFFSPSKMSSFRKKFKETAGIVQLQYRKAVMRMHLVEKAKDSLTILARFRLDDICLELIFKKLKNSELILLIASTKNEA